MSSWEAPPTAAGADKPALYRSLATSYAGSSPASAISSPMPRTWRRWCTPRSPT
ncbi:MAG: hypothetical protein U1F30_08535 [Steroidobacteraceae bacterium]